MDKKSRELVMAKLYFKHKDYKMAEKSFNEYLAMNPEDVVALKIQAQVYEQLKRYDKAFSMYERCYLTEPERTGVLLDICRILQLDWLEQADYHKWLNLAAKAFPYNPIVVNLRSFIATLPLDNQSSPRNEIMPRYSNDDPLMKILDKLTTMEKRIENIEDKLNCLSISQTAPSFSPSKPLEFDKPKNNHPKEKDGDNEKVHKEAPTSPNTGGNVFLNSMNKLNLSSQGSWPSQTASPFSLSKPFEFDKPKNSPPQEKVQNEGIAGLNTSTTGNMFLDSINKLNLSNQGSWSSQTAPLFSFSKPLEFDKPKGDPPEETNDHNEKVQNEELTIEQTCTMEPIEIKTGEEDEDLLFEHRCKLYRLRDKEYKERGLGTIKALRHRTTGKGRLIMRRDAIGLVCLNCWECSKIELVRENSIRWLGLDASDGDPEPTIFLVKFKTPELTSEFMSHLENLFSDKCESSPQKLAPQPKSGEQISRGSRKGSEESEESEIQLVDPRLDRTLVEKARELQLPDLFYHDLKYQDPCATSDGCEED